MSVLIKASACGGRIRPFVSARPAEAEPSRDAIPAPPADDERLPRLLSENEALKQALEAARDSADDLELRAYERGRSEAAREKQADDTRTVALLEGIEAALSAWEQRLDGLDRLAPLLACSALSKVFDDDEKRSELVASTVTRQMRHLRRETVLAVHVSLADFADAELEALRSRLPSRSIDLIGEADMASGECRLDLQLGHIDLGLQSQWGQLSQLLDGLAREEAAT